MSRLLFVVIFYHSSHFVRLFQELPRRVSVDERERTLIPRIHFQCSSYHEHAETAEFQ